MVLPRGPDRSVGQSWQALKYIQTEVGGVGTTQKAQTMRVQGREKIGLLGEAPITEAAFKVGSEMVPTKELRQLLLEGDFLSIHSLGVSSFHLGSNEINRKKCTLRSIICFLDGLASFTAL